MLSCTLTARPETIPVGQLDVAWVKTDSGISRRFLRLGEPVGEDMVAVIAGVEEGDQLLQPPLR